MKQSIILDIFNGDRGHIETMKMPNGIRQTMKKVNCAYDELKNKLSPELLSLLENYTDTCLNHLLEEVNFYFVEGFKLGVRIGIECMDA